MFCPVNEFNLDFINPAYRGVPNAGRLRINDGGCLPCKSTEQTPASQLRAEKRDDLSR